MRGASGELAILLFIGEQVAAKHGCELLLTHGSDGVHGIASKHYSDPLGAADAVAEMGGMVVSADIHNEILVDWRVRVAAFSNDWQVMLEDPGEPNMHFHAEVDRVGAPRV